MRVAHVLSLAVAAVASAASAAGITVNSSAIAADGVIGAAYSAYGANQSMPVSWTAAPGAKTYAVVLEDPDALGPAPFVHWQVWNIPAGTRQLAAGAPPPAGAVQGRNGTGSTGYHGPHPPSGTHHYHLRVFALNTALALPPGAERDALTAAMRGHVIASGETIGLYSAPRR